MLEIRRSGNKPAIILLLMAIVIIGITVTSAYFIINTGQNDPEGVTVNMGDLSLTFRDTDTTVENITGSWNFGDTIEKELLIENTGTRDVYAEIKWKNLINSYLPESLTYTLEKKKDENNSSYEMVDTTSRNIPHSDVPSTFSLTKGLLIPSGAKYVFRVRITLENLSNVDQTTDINTKFVSGFSLNESRKLSLIEKITMNYKTGSPDFAKKAMTDETADGLFAMEDDYGLSYYFRGAVSNNYVKFGRNSNGQEMWWRIIRINGDGSMRLQYDGLSSNESYYEKLFAYYEEPWNSVHTDAKYVGWMFGGTNESSISKEEAQRNETDSEIKRNLDNWYKENIVDTGFHDYVSDSIFCNDRSILGKNESGYIGDTGFGYGKKATA